MPINVAKPSERTDYIHGEEELKKVVVSDIAKYIHKNDKMSVLLDRLRKGGKKLFLLTNSEFNYTNSVMTYLLGDANPEYSSWRDYFGTACPPPFDRTSRATCKWDS